jgi:hypothetical protein
MQQSSQKDLLRMVKAELEQQDMELPRDQGAREALVNGTRAYILAVAKDAVSVEFRVFSSGKKWKPRAQVW